MEKIKFNIKNIIRPCCEDFEPYIAGKPVETIKRELGLKKVIKLASNENPLGPSKKAKDAVRKAVNELYFYPDSNAWNLKSAISRKFKIKSENITLGAGSDELIEIISEVFFKPTDEVIVSEHAFIQYKRAGRLMDSKVISVPMKELKHNIISMADAVGPNTKAIFIANPNNPTGTYNTKNEFNEFLNIVKQRAVFNLPLIILDEAYYEYARLEKDYPETFGYLADWPNLIILRTFSKIYGLAGLRIGYAFASKEIVSYMERVRPPFNISSLAQVAAIKSLEDSVQVTKSLSLVKKEKKYLYAQFNKMNVRFVPSAANFILVDTSPLKGAEVFDFLLKEGVIIRAMNEYKFPNHIRVSIGLKEENEKFVEAFKKMKKTIGGK